MRNRVTLLTMACAIAICTAVGLLAVGEDGFAQSSRKTKLAPAEVFQPPFPYSLGIAVEGKRAIFVAGQVALDAKGALVGKDDPAAQPRQVFNNMKVVLAAAGAKMDDVVKITMIVRNAADFPKIGGVRKEFFSEPYPASTAFVAALLNPDWFVEVEAIALVD